MSLTNLLFQHLKSLYLLYDPKATFSHLAQNMAYTNLIILTVLASIICLILVAVAYVLSYSTIKNAEQASEYECGFDPFDTATRRPFEVHFYVVGILFLIFDVEIALIFPWVLSLNAASWFAFYVMLLFLLIVTVGFIAEWHRGVLTWPKKANGLLLASAVGTSNTSCSPEMGCGAQTSCDPLSGCGVNEHINYDPAIAKIWGDDPATNRVSASQQVWDTLRLGREDELSFSEMLGEWVMAQMFPWGNEVYAPFSIDDPIWYHIALRTYHDNMVRSLTSDQLEKVGGEEQLFTSMETALLLLHCLMDTVVEPKKSSALIRNNWILDTPLAVQGGEVYWYALPEILLLFFVVVIVLLSSSAYRFCSSTNYKLLAVKHVKLSIQFLILVLLVYSWLLYYHIDFGTSVFLFGDNVVIDLYTTTCKVVVLLLVLLVLTLSYYYIYTHPRNIIDYSTYILLGTFFLVVLISANNFMTVLFGLMGFSYNLYVLIASDTGRESVKALTPGGFYSTAPVSTQLREVVYMQGDRATVSTEAAIKYFTLSALSSGLVSASLSLLWIFSGTLNFSKLFWILSFTTTSVSQVHSAVTLWDFILIFLIYGFLFKLAAYPCHLWAPDVYSGTPGPVLAFIMMPVKVGVFAIFAKIILNVFRDLYSVWSLLLTTAALGSLIWGCLGAYKTFLVKKFLAFSSMNQFGFVLAGVACCSVSGLTASVIFLFLYLVSQILIFQFILNVRPIVLPTQTHFPALREYEVTYLHEFRLSTWHISHRPYILGLCIVFFSMAGIPPLGGFFSKYLVLNSAFQAGYNSLVITCMLTSMVSTYYYLRVIKIMTFGLPYTVGAYNTSKPVWVFSITTWQSFVYFGGLIAIVAFPVYYSRLCSMLYEMLVSGLIL